MSSAEQKVAAVTASRDDGNFRREVVDGVIKKRFANRTFSKRPVSRQTVEDILEVARFAPSGANIQPWRVYVLGGAEKDRVSCALLKAHNEARDQHRSEYQYYAPQLPEPYLSRREQFGHESTIESGTKVPQGMGVGAKGRVLYSLTAIGVPENTAIGYWERIRSGCILMIVRARDADDADYFVDEWIANEGQDICR